MSSPPSTAKKPIRTHPIKSAAVYVVDKNGYELVRHAATSFLVTQSNFQDVHVFCHNFMPDPADRLIKIAQETGVQVHIEPIDDPNLNEIKINQYTPRAALLKFKSVSQIAHAYDRVLYVDHDILFFEEVFLEEVDLEGFPVGAVYDLAEISGLANPSFAQNCHNNNRSAHYFNTGLMLFDCSQWDRELEYRYLQLLEAHSLKCDYKTNCTTIDQCAFNRLFENNWKRLSLNFNMQACAIFTGGWAHASVRHYQGKKKFLPIQPWRNDSRDLRLIKRVRTALGYHDFLYPPCNIMYGLNAIRKKGNIERANIAITLAELMSSEPIQASQNAGHRSTTSTKTGRLMV
jgi:lipopolysaccharide biosynthesis glycosyltransferase